MRTRPETRIKPHLLIINLDLLTSDHVTSLDKNLILLHVRRNPTRTASPRACVLVGLGQLHKQSVVHGGDGDREGELEEVDIGGERGHGGGIVLDLCTQCRFELIESPLESLSLSFAHQPCLSPFWCLGGAFEAHGLAVSLEPSRSLFLRLLQPLHSLGLSVA